MIHPDSSDPRRGPTARLVPSLHSASVLRPIASPDGRVVGSVGLCAEKNGTPRFPRSFTEMITGCFSSKNNTEHRSTATSFQTVPWVEKLDSIPWRSSKRSSQAAALRGEMVIGDSTKNVVPKKQWIIRQQRALC